MDFGEFIFPKLSKIPPNPSRDMHCHVPGILDSRICIAPFVLSSPVPGMAEEMHCGQTMRGVASEVKGLDLFSKVSDLLSSYPGSTQPIAIAASEEDLPKVWVCAQDS